MKNSLFFKETSLFSPADALLRVTALQYLRDALLKEEYESCKELADRARQFGAPEDEIAQVFAAASQDKGGEPQEASLRKSRLTIKKGQ